MEQIILIVHIMIIIALIALILIQQGKGANMGAAFGSGASNTMFGSQGNVPFLMKVTACLAVGFFITSLTLSYYSYKRNKVVQPAASPSETIPVPASTTEQNSVPVKRNQQ